MKAITVSDWSSGYNVDVPYPHGFYERTDPRWLDFVATFNGISHPSGNWRYLELGCGNGFGLIMLAALNPDHDFVGIDFEPGHIAYGRSLARAAGLNNIQFIEADFLEIAGTWPQSLGQFDYVVAHGLVSWINQAVRNAVIKTINHAAQPGALVYLSYNAMPGQAARAPIQHLLRLWQTTEAMPPHTAISSGRQRLEELIKADSTLAKEMPLIEVFLDNMKGYSPNYLVHEFLHDSWQPLWFDSVVKTLEPAKLTFVGPAEIGSCFPETVLPKELTEMLEGYKNRVVREVMIDTFLNRGFRADIFSRGAQPLWTVQQEQRVGEVSLCLGNRNTSGDIEFELLERKVSGKSASFLPFIEMLKSGPKPISELMAANPKTQGSFAQVKKVTMYMLQSGCANLHLPPCDKAPAKRLNRVLCDHVAEGAPYRHMIASETGSVIKLPYTDLLMLSEAHSATALPTPKILGQRLVDWHLERGKAMSDPEAGQAVPKSHMLPHAITLATVFLNEQYPQLKDAGVF